MAGPGCGAMGDVPVLPFTGGLPSGDPGVLTESLNHSSETGNAGYYTVKHRLDPGEDRADDHRAHRYRALHLPGHHAGRRPAQAAGQPERHHRPPARRSSAPTRSPAPPPPAASAGRPAATRCTSTWSSTSPSPPRRSSPRAGQPGPNSVFLNFNTSSNQVVQAKVGLSYVSAANASANLAAEKSGFNFSTVQTAAHNAWNAQLGKIQIAGGTADPAAAVLHLALPRAAAPEHGDRRQRPVHGLRQRRAHRGVRPRAVRPVLRLGHLQGRRRSSTRSSTPRSPRTRPSRW